MFKRSGYEVMSFSRARNARVCACAIRVCAHAGARATHNHITSLPEIITYCFNYTFAVMSLVMSGYAALADALAGSRALLNKQYIQGVK